MITGATSGIGLTTARQAAKQGAKVVLVARNENALRELADEIGRGGGKAIFSAADVADETALRRAADLAEREFGGIDTWVNNAGGSIYGRIMDVPTDDLRRLFETNVWGVVNGSRVAVEHLREKGGALINLGSEVSDSPIPLQGNVFVFKTRRQRFYRRAQNGTRSRQTADFGDVNQTDGDSHAVSRKRQKLSAV